MPASSVTNGDIFGNGNSECNNIANCDIFGNSNS